MTVFERMDNTIRRSPVWRSIFRQPYPNDERSRAYAVVNNVFLHIHPVRVRPQLLCRNSVSPTSILFSRVAWAAKTSFPRRVLSAASRASSEVAVSYPPSSPDRST